MQVMGDVELNIIGIFLIHRQIFEKFFQIKKKSRNNEKISEKKNFLIGINSILDWR